MSTRRTSFLLLAFVLTSAFLLSPPFVIQSKTSAEAKNKCSIILSPEQSLQEAIDNAQTSSVICLSKGRWKEAVSIDKSITLKGLGNRPEVYTKKANSLTIYVTKKAGLVTLQNLKVSSYARAYGSRPIIQGASKLVIDDCIIAQEKESRTWGLLFWLQSEKGEGSPDLRISETLFTNVGVSIYPSESSIKARILDSTISSNSYGLGVGKSRSDKDEPYRGPRAKVTVKNSLIEGSGDKGEEAGTGVYLADGAKVEMISSTISNFPEKGFHLLGTGSATIKSSVIKYNRGNGLTLQDLSQVTVHNSEITQNQGSGIFISSRSQYPGNELNEKLLYQYKQLPSSLDAVIEDNKIADNGGYGVVVFTGKCGLEKEKEAIGFWGGVMGARNRVSNNGEGSFCPEELSFLSSKEGGRYP